MSDISFVPVVSVAFREVIHTSKFQEPFKKVGEPILQLEILGDRHNLELVGKLLFDYYLREIIDEDLDDHMWRFEPNELEEQPCLALDPSIPILSKDMHVSNPFNTRNHSPSPYRIEKGFDLRFKYDEGSPTHLMATIESITPLPEGKTVDQYPAKKADPLEHLAGEKCKRIAEIPVRTIVMDEAYPYLKNRLFERCVRLEIGRGSDPIPDTLEHGYWARIWGGDPNSGFDRSLESQRPFEDLNEAWLCFDRAIQKQTSPNFPACTTLIEYQNSTTGQIYRKKGESYLDISVTANVLPASVPVDEYPPEMERDMVDDHNSCSRQSPGDDVPLQFWSRYCFNFALQTDWQDGPDTPDFNFPAQFPKVTAWLTRPCSTSRWLYVERGVLCAVKGKNNPRAAEKVAHRTLKHNTLHAMFADLEESLVLPKSWKLTKNGK